MTRRKGAPRVCRAGARPRRARAAPRRSPAGLRRPRLRPSSSANNGLPSVASTILRRSCRCRLRSSRSASMRRVAPRLSGPTSTRFSGASARSTGAVPAGPPGEHEDDGAVVQAPRGEGERVAGGGVQPLEVVDGDQQRAVRRERAQRVPEAERDRAAVGRLTVRFHAQERHLQRRELGGRHALEAPEIHTVEQIDQAREGQLRLRPAGPGRDDTASRAPARRRSRPPRASSCRFRARPSARARASPCLRRGTRPARRAQALARQARP